MDDRALGPLRPCISSGKATLCPMAFGKSIVTTMFFSAADMSPTSSVAG